MGRRSLILWGLLFSLTLFFAACAEPAVSGTAMEAAAGFTKANLQQVAEKDSHPLETAETKQETTPTPAPATIEDPKSTVSEQKPLDNSSTGQVQPVQPASQTKPTSEETKENDALTCTFSIYCTNAVNNEALDEEKAALLPADGAILAPQEVTFAEGDTVFDLLLQLTKKNKIHMEFSTSPLYETRYIEGIQNLYEFDCGELSGWMYKVNGVFPKYGCSQYVIEDGDTIEWLYTCDLGRDVGSTFGAGGQQGEVTP